MCIQLAEVGGVAAFVRVDLNADVSQEASDDGRPAVGGVEDALILTAQARQRPTGLALSHSHRGQDSVTWA